MDVREKLVDIIQNSVGGCARHWAEIIADGLIAHGVTVQEWISVKDRLPEKWQDIIAYDAKNQEIHLAYTTEDAWVGVRMNGKVTHWMPLPQPTKGE
jgi:hypothetical protein